MDDRSYKEADLEKAIISNLQQFLLELGKGFAFVERQQRIRFADEDFYLDLVFYNFKLKCFVLIDQDRRIPARVCWQDGLLSERVERQGMGSRRQSVNRHHSVRREKRCRSRIRSTIQGQPEWCC